MQDIIKWLNDATNRKLIALLLIIAGIAQIIGGALGIAIDYSLGSGIFGENYGISSDVVSSMIASFSFTAIFSFLLGIIFIILGIRVVRK